MQNPTLQQLYKLRQELESKDTLLSLYKATAYALDDVLVETEQEMKDYRIGMYISWAGLIMCILLQMFAN